MKERLVQLRQLLLQPERALHLTLADWDLLVRQARHAGLLARLALLLEETGALPQVPEAPRAHLEAERILADKHRRDVLWEVSCIGEVLRRLSLPLILLKGAAYVVADLPAARGRVFSDIDILVPKERIDEVEAAFRDAGWVSQKMDRWDQRFYRRWMHQIPPLLHAERGAAIDIHHTIVPATARIALSAATLREFAQPVSGQPDLFVLAPPDMVLHSATHLFNEGEFDRGLRDLFDLDLLLRHFGEDASFWLRLAERAGQLDLERPLFYCLRYASRLLGTPLPAETLAAAERLAPAAALRTIMDFLFERALRPAHMSCRDRWSGLALWLLYARAHHLRLPPHLLVPHLARKAALRRLKELGFAPAR